MMCDMGLDPRQRLGQLMADRRRELRLTIVAAAAKAGFDRMTWSNAEKGLRLLAESNWAGVEQALDWAAGSVAAVFSGGDPKLKPAAQTITPDGIPSTSSVGEPRIVQGTASASLGGLRAEARGTVEPYDLDKLVDEISQLHDLPVEDRMQMVRRLVAMHKERLQRDEAAQADAQTA